MRKVIELDERFPTGEFTVQPAVLVGRNGRPLREELSKTASDATDFIKSVQPKPGHTIILVLALGSYERYGLNRNADGFNENAFRVGQRPLCGHDACFDPDGWVGQKDVISQHFKSFETHGKFYRHHQNTDPAKAIGEVIKAFWNPTMHRVELLTAIKNELAPDLVERIADGFYPAVSMGCSPRGYPVLLADGSYVPVQNVREGDEVITHKGRVGRVTETMERRHAGSIFTLAVEGFRQDLQLTGEHPLWLLRAEDLKCRPSAKGQKRRQAKCTPGAFAVNAGCGGCTTAFAPEFDWVRTDAAREGDYLAMPIPRFAPTRSFTREEARFLGYYLAEGFVWENNNASRGNKNTVATVFATNINETATHEELRDLGMRLGARSTFDADQADRNGKLVHVVSDELAALCTEHCGAYAKTKRLSASILGAPPEILKEFLGAYLNGDGFVHNNTLFASTASPGLADQLQIAFARCGMIARVQTLEHGPSPVVSIPTTEYQLAVSPETGHLLKTARFSVTAPKTSLRRRFFYEFEGVTYLVSKISEITETAYDDQVFNFEVDGDNSYLLNNVAVHNCKIKYDVCTVCGHRAPTRKQYCEHMKFSARQVHSSGTHIGVLNPSPRWFDISAVIKPADQTGFTLQKVAEASYAVKSSAALGDYLERVEEKRAALRKIADIDKVIRGVALDHKTSPLSEPEAKSVRQYRDTVLPALQSMPRIDNKTLSALSKHSLPEVLSTLSAAGVILTTPEFVTMFVNQLAPGVEIPENILDRMTAMQGEVFDLYAAYPQLLDQMVDGGALALSGDKVRPEIGEKAEKYLEKRSTISDYLSRTLIPRALRKEEAPNTDLLTLTDPSTGVDYATNRGAAIKMHDSIARSQLAKVLGGATLLAGGAKIVSAGLPDPLKPLSWGTAALMGNSLLRPDYGPHYMTHQGVSIPAGTELKKISSAGDLASVALPVLGTTALVAGLGHDYEARQRAGHVMHHPDASLPSKAFDATSKYVHDNPASSTLLGLLLYGMGKGQFMKKAADTVTLPEIDIDALAEKIGCLFFE